MTKQAAPFAVGDRDPERRELVEQGQALARRRDDTNWDLGDLALTVATTYGEGNLAAFAERIGFKREKVKQCRRVSAFFEKGTRVPNVPWTHHRRLVGNDSAAEWLALALEHGWSERDLVWAMADAVNVPGWANLEVSQLHQDDKASEEVKKEALRLIREDDGSALRRKSLNAALNGVRRHMATIGELLEYAKVPYGDRPALRNEIAGWRKTLVELEDVAIGSSFFDDSDEGEHDEEQADEADFDAIFEAV